MQALFQADVPNSDVQKSIDMLLEEGSFIEETKEFSRKLVSGTSSKLEEIDRVIKEYSKNWSFDRISSVDKSILRLSIYELLYLKENPPSVVINEALEMAKKYSDEVSAKFINGILGAIVSGSVSQKK